MLALCPEVCLYVWTYVHVCASTACMYRIDHCVAGCMTRYLPRGKLSPAEAEEVRGRSLRYF